MYVLCKVEEHIYTPSKLKIDETMLEHRPWHTTPNQIKQQPQYRFHSRSFWHPGFGFYESSANRRKNQTKKRQRPLTKNKYSGWFRSCFFKNSPSHSPSAADTGVPLLPTRHGAHPRPSTQAKTRFAVVARSSGVGIAKEVRNTTANALYEYFTPECTHTSFHSVNQKIVHITWKASFRPDGSTVSFLLGTIYFLVDDFVFRWDFLI